MAWWDKQKPPGTSKEQWEQDRATHLADECEAIENRQRGWHEFNLWNARLYYNRDLPAFRWGDLDAESELYPADLRTENLVMSIGDSMLAKASSQPLLPSPVPHGASYSAKQAVEKLQKFLAATYVQTDAENVAVQAFLDAYVSSIGAARVVHENDVLSVEPIFFDNIIIDNRECVNRAPPRTVRIRTVMPRAAAESRWGKLREQKRNYTNYREVGTDWVVIFEAYRKPDRDGNGGCHMVAGCGKILDVEDWNEDWIPIVFFHWADPGSGFFSRSGVEQCVPYQINQNDINDAIKKTQDICTRPRLLAHASSNIDVNQWDTEFGRILGYTGVKPEPFEWPTNLNDLYQERERNRASCYSYFGLSEFTSAADLPPQVRLDSSAGVREFRNMEDGRHLRLWTRFEQFRLEIAHRFIDVLARSKSKFRVIATSYMDSGKASTEMISWADVRDVKKEQYTWTLQSVPLRMMSPAARRETLSAWMAQGRISPEDDVSMIGNPDLEKIEEQEMTDVEDCHRMFSLMEQGKYESPAEYTNFTYGIRACVQNIKILKKYTEGVHPEAIALHEKWLLEAMNTQKAAVEAMQAQLPAPGFDPAQGVQGKIS